MDQTSDMETLTPQIAAMYLGCECVLTDKREEEYMLILKKGRQYVIDKDFANSGIVILVEYGKNFCRVEDPDTGHMWNTMTSRLSEINTQSL